MSLNARFTLRRIVVPSSPNNHAAMSTTLMEGHANGRLRTRSFAPRLVLFLFTIMMARPEGASPAPRAIEESHVSAQFKVALIDASQATGVPLALLVALIDQETAGTWNSSIVVQESNGTVSIGLAQANSRWLDYFRCKFGLIDPTNAEQSIWFAARYLRWLYDNGPGSWYEANVDYKQGLNDKLPSFQLAAVASAICFKGGIE